MSAIEELARKLGGVPELRVARNELLAPYTRFAIGGPASLFVDTASPDAFCRALRSVTAGDVPHLVIGGGTNLVVSDEGFQGIVLRFTGSEISHKGDSLTVEAGAVLQDVVDASIGLGLSGMETMTGIPGYLGGAVYGNAGAYGHSIQERVETVTFAEGGDLRTIGNAECQFAYRESVFKERKDWVILRAELRFGQGNTQELAQTATNIRRIRDEKYPPTMKCAGSIFKNLFLDDLPERVRAEVPAEKVREGKVPSAWFLEQARVKGLRRGDIQVATYHANLIYNDGNGSAADLVAVIEEVKRRVRERFGFNLEEEVQYVGFAYANA